MAKSYKVPGTKYKVSQHDLIVGAIGGAAVGVIALLMWPKGPAGFSGMTRGFAPPGFSTSAVHPPVIPHNPLLNGGPGNYLTPQVDYNGDSKTYFSRGYYYRNPGQNPAQAVNVVPVFNAAYNGYSQNTKYAPPIPAPAQGVYYPGDGRVRPTMQTPTGRVTF